MLARPRFQTGGPPRIQVCPQPYSICYPSAKQPALSIFPAGVTSGIWRFIYNQFTFIFFLAGMRSYIEILFLGEPCLIFTAGMPAWHPVANEQEAALHWELVSDSFCSLPFNILGTCSSSVVQCDQKSETKNLGVSLKPLMDFLMFTFLTAHQIASEPVKLPSLGEQGPHCSFHSVTSCQDGPHTAFCFIGLSWAV